MASYISEVLHCEDCGHSFDELIERAKRDELHECPECGNLSAKRTWTIPNVRTAKTSTTIPDVVAKGRFDDIRLNQQLKREKQKARVSGDRESEKKIEREIQRSKK